VAQLLAGGKSSLLYCSFVLWLQEQREEQQEALQLESENQRRTFEKDLFKQKEANYQIYPAAIHAKC
jgi:hypothetical protein